MFDKRKGRFGNVLNMIQEHLSEYVFDGDGRPVIEKEGFQTYHVNDSPPNSPLTAAPKMYQVWSTVLGSNLTTVKPDETKWETKIFAGGALIAKEGATGPHWMTSDPVTGTTATWRKIDNDWLTSVEETEPLGQKIYGADPNPVPDPTYDNAIRNADYPQWQCAIREKSLGGFMAMPLHCQLAEWKRSGSKTPYEIEAEENPQDVTDHKSGSGSGSDGESHAGSAPDAGEDATATQKAFNRLMNYTLASTRKPTKHTGEQKGDDDDEPIRVETHTSRITGNAAKGETGGKPLETGWVEAAMSNWQEDVISQGFDDVERILSTDNSCSRFLGLAGEYELDGGYGEVVTKELPRMNILPILNALRGQMTVGFIPGDSGNRQIGIIQKNTNSFGRSNSASILSNTPEYQQFDIAVANINGPLFRSGPRIGGYAANSRQGIALAILHEIAHLIRTGRFETVRNNVNALNRPYLIPADGGDSDASTANSALVESQCRDELAEISRRRNR